MLSRAQVVATSALAADSSFATIFPQKTSLTIVAGAAILLAIDH
jgi:hypothetical protein